MRGRAWTGHNHFAQAPLAKMSPMAPPHAREMKCAMEGGESTDVAGALAFSATIV